MPDSEAFDFVIVGAGLRSGQSSDCVGTLPRCWRQDQRIGIPGFISRSDLAGSSPTGVTIGVMRPSRSPDVTTAKSLRRGKVLGGSSSIKGLIYIRGQAEDFKQLRNAGWSFDDVLPYFRKAEDNERGADEFHGTGGPLGVSDLRDRHPLAVAYVEAAVQCGYPRNDDFNGATQEGAGFYQTTMKNGIRSSTAAGYLKQVRRRPNLKVVPEALATRITFDGRRATGVDYLAGNEKRSARANAEVIVASGTFNSPQLLQLSGVGPATLFRSHGLAVVADAPGVGEDLNDHISGRIIHHRANHRRRWRHQSLDLMPRFWPALSKQRRPIAEFNCAAIGVSSRRRPSGLCR